ncbi:MAG: toxin-antitoxin system YwqK family antitoxin [Chlamydiales bacterium]|nr:toxin-antitoxin system YwqK family antitoxin [Chlamydiales bacterium]
MKIPVTVLLSAATLVFVGCNNKKKNPDEEVVSQRYIHKYGYDLSKNEWEEEEQPGQIVTTQRNGVTIVSTYDNGILQGPTTETYPHSQTLRVRQMFNKGILSKQIFYDIRGIPQKEESYLSPTQIKVVSWYKNGTPKSLEEYSSGDLIAGEYYNQQNELESKVDKGKGVRTLRSQNGDLLSKEFFDGSRVVQRETFHANGVPHEVVNFLDGKSDGEKSKFGMTGEPLLYEHWKSGKLHGVATYFQNGYKYLEIPYVNGEKHGIEKQYIDGEILSNETQWFANKKHGPAISYCDGITKTEWFYNNEKVSRKKYEELCEREQEIATLQERANNSSWNF